MINCGKKKSEKPAFELKYLTWHTDTSQAAQKRVGKPFKGYQIA